VPDIPKGTVLKDDDVLDVPESKTIKVLLLPSQSHQEDRRTLQGQGARLRPLDHADRAG
jgi:hypothetical protein